MGPARPCAGRGRGPVGGCVVNPNGVIYVVDLSSPNESVTWTDVPVECYRVEGGAFMRRRVYTASRDGRFLCRFTCTASRARKVWARDGIVHIRARDLVRYPGEE